MVRNLIVEIELAEPAVRKLQRHFLAQPALMTNAIAVTDQEHPDHQLGIDRGPADVAVKCLQLLVQIAQNGCREHVDPSQQVVRRDHLVEAKLVKQLPLISVLPPHHRRLSCRLLSRNHCSLGFSTPFSTASTPSGNLPPADDGFCAIDHRCPKGKRYGASAAIGYFPTARQWRK